MSETECSTPRVIPVCPVCDIDGPAMSLLMYLHAGGGNCPDCGTARTLVPHQDPDYDPTPWCSGCGAMKKSDCHCGPIAENE
jgi:hypothetical protein